MKIFFHEILQKTAKVIHFFAKQCSRNRFNTALFLSPFPCPRMRLVDNENSFQLLFLSYLLTLWICPLRKEIPWNSQREPITKISSAKFFANYSKIYLCFFLYDRIKNSKSNCYPIVLSMQSVSTGKKKV